MCVLTCSVYSDEIFSHTYSFYNPEVTVVFPNTMDVTPERQEDIARMLAGIPSTTFNNPDYSSPDNIICTIFGHDLDTSTVTVTHHKVSQYSPRCILDIYHVTYCKRCNYTDPELTSSFYIVCCPEE